MLVACWLVGFLVTLLWLAFETLVGCLFYLVCLCLWLTYLLVYFVFGFALLLCVPVGNFGLLFDWIYFCFIVVFGLPCVGL